MGTKQNNWVKDWLLPCLSVVGTVAAAAAAIGSCVSARHNYYAQCLSNEIAKANQEPQFIFMSYLPELEILGHNPYSPTTTDGEMLVNYGDAPREIHDIGIKKIWIFRKGLKEYVVPVNDYYGLGWHHHPNSYKDVIVKTFNISNHWHEAEMWTWCTSNNIVFTPLKVAYVDYTTRIGSRMTKYFRNGRIVDGEIYSNSVNKISVECQYGKSYEHIDYAEILRQMTDR